jgi:hypothetical protein
LPEVKNENSKNNNNKKDYESLLKEKDRQIQMMQEEIQILKKSIGIFSRNPHQK